MGDRERSRMQWRQYSGIIVFALSGLAFCSAIEGVWPVLVGRLNSANWMALIFSHVTLLISIAGLYVNARKRVVSGTFEVLLVASLALMVSGLDLSLLHMPGVR